MGYKDVICPTCGEAKGWPCCTSSGFQTSPHATRVRLALMTELSAAKNEIKELRKDRDHWKAALRDVEQERKE